MPVCPVCKNHVARVDVLIKKSTSCKHCGSILKVQDSYAVLGSISIFILIFLASKASMLFAFVLALILTAILILFVRVDIDNSAMDSKISEVKKPTRPQVDVNKNIDDYRKEMKERKNNKKFWQFWI